MARTLASVPDELLPEANALAFKRNRASLINALQSRKLNDEALTSFLYEYVDAYSIAKDSKFHRSLDVLAPALEETATHKSAFEALRKQAISVASDKGFSFKRVETSMLLSKLETPQSVVGEIIAKRDAHERAMNSVKTSQEHLKAGVSGIAMFAWEDALKPLGNLVISGFKGIGRGTKRLGIAGGHTIASIDHIIKAGLQKSGYNPLWRVPGYATLALGGFMLATMPISAAGHESVFTHGITTAFKESCDPEGSAIDAAFAVGVKGKNASADLAKLAALQGMDAGVSPLAIYLISMLETKAGQDVMANNSSATGLFQSLGTSTKIEWVAKYGPKTKQFIDAKERIAQNTASANDTALVTSIEFTAAEYKKNKKELLKQVSAGKVPQAVSEAALAADTTVLSGQIMAEVIKAEAPALARKADTLNEMMGQVSAYYTNHLAGNAGGSYLTWLAANHPTVKMNDTATLKKLYDAYPQRDKTFAPKAGTYYAAITKSNGGVFKDGAGVSAKDFAKAIDTYVRERSKPTTDAMHASVKGAKNVFEVCAKEPDKFKGIVPEQTTYTELAIKKTQNWAKDKIDANLSPETQTQIADAAVATATFAAKTYDTASEKLFSTATQTPAATPAYTSGADAFIPLAPRVEAPIAATETPQHKQVVVAKNDVKKNPAATRAAPRKEFASAGMGFKDDPLGALIVEASRENKNAPRIADNTPKR